MSIDSDSPEVIASRQTETEAAMLVAGLREYGIEAILWNSGLTAAGAEAVFQDAVQVVVKRADVERAKAALADLLSKDGGVNWDEVDVGKPED